MTEINAKNIISSNNANLCLSPAVLFDPLEATNRFSGEAKQSVIGIPNMKT